MSGLGLGCAKTFRNGPKPIQAGLLRVWSHPEGRRGHSDDVETPRRPAPQARIAARSGFTPTMFITRVRL
jgi:hypothetical protein